MKLSERRQNPRVRQVYGKAVVLARRKDSAIFTVEDLSTGGARIAGRLPLAVGEVVRLLLMVEGREPIWVVAEVVRLELHDRLPHVAGLAFRDVPSLVQDRIQRVVLDALERQRANSPPLVLVVNGVLEVCDALERDLSALGKAVVSAVTPLEAVWHLQDPGLRFETAVVEQHLGQTDAVDILGYLKDEHPHIRRVLLSGRSETLEREVSGGRADAFLTKPWQPQALAQALARS